MALILILKICLAAFVAYIIIKYNEVDISDSSGKLIKMLSKIKKLQKFEKFTKAIDLKN